ncbi:IS701 family transposase [Rhizobium sp. BK661]|uniref:IS701 family transposase n=1 Tax=Rhizobium sp. BK661 TaxID=2586991 RepID=UPI00216871C1|nr:IS701 family transposase [Rhizobium sp. BK661]
MAFCREGSARRVGCSEEAGLDHPYRLQSLLGRSSRSADALCDRVRRYVADALGDADGVLVVDETGFVKKGEHSVGVTRQYSGTAGRVENCQVGVFAAYASRFFHALIDRRLYLPKGWAENQARRVNACVPEDAAFASKPAMAREMVSRILDEGIPCAFVLADAVYGSDHKFRQSPVRLIEPIACGFKIGAGSLALWGK